MTQYSRKRRFNVVLMTLWRSQVQGSTAALDAVTSAHVGLDFFGGIGDFQAWRDESLAPAIAELRSLTGWGDEALEILGEPDATSARKMIQQVVTACDCMTDVSSVAFDLRQRQPSFGKHPAALVQGPRSSRGGLLWQAWPRKGHTILSAVPCRVHVRIPGRGDGCGT